MAALGAVVTNRAVPPSLVYQRLVGVGRRPFAAAAVHVVARRAVGGMIIRGPR
jgi:hypothetical protein